MHTLNPIYVSDPVLRQKCPYFEFFYPESLLIKLRALKDTSATKVFFCHKLALDM